MPAHRVQQGECLSTIAARYGFRWRRVWEHPDNEALRELRKSPNVLHPGDVVHVPDRDPKTESAPTGNNTKIRDKELTIGTSNRNDVASPWAGSKRAKNSLAMKTS